MTDTLNGEKLSSEEDGVHSRVTRDVKQGGHKGIHGAFVWVVRRQEGNPEEAELHL